MRFLLIAVVVLAAACSPKTVTNTATVTKDSIVYMEKVVHDTLRLSSSKVTTNWDATADTTFDERSGRAEIKIVETKGKIFANCKCDSVEIAKKFSIRDTIHHYIKNTVKSKAEIKFIASPFDKFCRWFFIACCVLAAFYIGFKIAK